MREDRIKCKSLGIYITPAECLYHAKKEVIFWGKEAPKYNGGCPCARREEMMAKQRKCEDCGRIIYNGKVCGRCQKERREQMENNRKEETAPAVYEEAAVEDKRFSKRRVAKCGSCGDTKEIKGRGYCAPCYYKLVEVPNKQAKEKINLDVLASRMGPHPVDWPKDCDKVVEKHPDLPTGGDDDAKQVHQGSVPVYPSGIRPGMTLLELLFVDEIDLKILAYIEAEAKRCRRKTQDQALWILQSHYEASKEAA